VWEARGVVGVERVGVLGAARPDLAEVGRERRLQAIERARPSPPHGAEVADVERRRRRTAGLVLGQRPRGGLDRHLPAPEGDQLGAGCAVAVVEKGVLQRPPREATGRDLVAPSPPRSAEGAGSEGKSSTMAASTCSTTPSSASRLSTPWPW